MHLETQTVLEFLMPPQKIKLQKQLKELKMSSLILSITPKVRSKYNQHSK